MHSFNAQTWCTVPQKCSCASGRRRIYQTFPLLFYPICNHLTSHFWRTGHHHLSSNLSPSLPSKILQSQCQCPSAIGTIWPLCSSNYTYCWIWRAFVCGGGDIYGNQLLQFLQHMWSLVKLDIGNLECLDNHLFDASHYCGTYSQHLVPKLTTLLLTAILDSINENRIASMIKSWWWTDDELHTVSHFKRVSIDLWGWALDVSMEKWLEHCHQEGLVWTLSWIVKPWIIYSSYVHISNTDIGGGGSSDIIAGGWSLVLLFNLMSLYF